MPWTVEPKYIAVLRHKFSEKYGRQTSLDDSDISEMVNLCYSSRKLTEDEEAALTVIAMLDKERTNAEYDARRSRAS